MVPPERSSALLVMISSKSVSICKRSHARLAITVAEIAGFEVCTVYPNLMPSYGGLLEGSKLYTVKHFLHVLERFW